MIFTMLISLYTSRVLLQNLGIDDFGIYGVVGGLVAMFASLKTMFTISTQRYLNIELGKGDHNELNKVFNISVLVNFAIACIFIICVEVIGIWLLEYKLQIPTTRIFAAKVVFQVSIFSSALTILNIPYDSIIIAHEKMNVFAIMSVLDTVLKLCAVLLLPYLSYDRLIIYAFAILGITIVNCIVNIAYCRLYFRETKLSMYSFAYIKDKFKEMLSLSGWAFLGSIIFAIVNEGLNILLNIFGGVVANASRTVTYQIRSSLLSIVSNVYVAIKPQAVQSYANNNIQRFYNLMFTGAKIVGYLYVFIAIPLFWSLNEILKLWLGVVPEYAYSFISASFLYLFVRVLHDSVGTFFITIGQMKEYQISELFVLGSSLPLSYIGLKHFAMPLYGIFIITTLTELLNLIFMLIIAKKIGKFDVKLYISNVILPYVLVTLVCLTAVFALKNIVLALNLSPVPHVALFLLLAFIAELIIIFTGLSKNEKKVLISLLNFKNR